jgi:hypothetical protein
MGSHAAGRDLQRPFWTRRYRMEEQPYEVCYHGTQDICDPIVVSRHYEQDIADDNVAILRAKMPRTIVNEE